MNLNKFNPKSLVNFFNITDKVILNLITICEVICIQYIKLLILVLCYYNTLINANNQCNNKM